MVLLLGLWSLLLLLLLLPASAWDLSPLALGSAQVSHVCLCGTRAFLSIPRQDESQQFSLAEASWPERTMPFPLYVRPFPMREPQVMGICSATQSAVSSDWDGYRHLFLLDSGWLNICPPKIVVFDLFMNKKVLDWELSGVNGTGLHSLVVDTGPPGPRAYVGQPEPGQLIVFDLRNRRSWQIFLSSPSPPDTLPRPPSTSQLALAGSNLYLISLLSDRLFKLDLTALRATSPPPESSNNSYPVVWEGKLLGQVSGVVADPRSSSLYYCLPSDYVCVRWDWRLPLVAESHQVLLQSAERLPRVHRLFLDLQKQPWALTDIVNGTHCTRIKPLNYPWP